jgi:hypothetical protein
MGTCRVVLNFWDRYMEWGDYEEFLCDQRSYTHSYRAIEDKIYVCRETLLNVGIIRSILTL